MAVFMKWSQYWWRRSWRHLTDGDACVATRTWFACFISAHDFLKLYVVSAKLAYTNTIYFQHVILYVLTKSLVNCFWSNSDFDFIFFQRNIVSSFLKKCLKPSSSDFCLILLSVEEHWLTLGFTHNLLWIRLFDQTSFYCISAFWLE